MSPQALLGKSATGRTDHIMKNQGGNRLILVALLIKACFIGSVNTIRIDNSGLVV